MFFILFHTTKIRKKKLNIQNIEFLEMPLRIKLGYTIDQLFNYSVL